MMKLEISNEPVYKTVIDSERINRVQSENAAQAAAFNTQATKFRAQIQAQEEEISRLNRLKREDIRENLRKNSAVEIEASRDALISKSKKAKETANVPGSALNFYNNEEGNSTNACGTNNGQST